MIYIILLLILILVILIGICGYNYINRYKYDNNPQLTNLVDAVLYQPPTLQSDYQQKIPFVIHQAYNTTKIPERRSIAIQTVIDQNREYTYKYYTEKDQREYMSKYFPQYLNAYNSLVPRAYQVDLFRYCLLYNEGGVYLDSGMTCHKPFRTFIPQDSTLVVPIDRWNSGLYNAFIASTKNHPVIQKTIDLAIERISNKQYGPNSLWITGPNVLASAYISVRGKKYKIGDDGERTYFLKHDERRLLAPSDIYDGKTKILTNKYIGYKTEDDFYRKSPGYQKLWEKRMVYR
jgi:mannosyltransferase OCH1-like enzyme